MATIALIPVKELATAKARLAPVLDEGARRDLALAMLRDVLEAALACRALDGAVIVSRDETVRGMARDHGTEATAQPGGLNEALTSAAEKLRGRAERLLVLAADLPRADPASMTAVVAANADVVVVPSGDGGTNALLLPPGAIAFQYGRNSAARHVAAAEAARRRTLRLELDMLALDIDTPADLERLRDLAKGRQPVGRHTLAALERSGLLSAAR
jgi:2-phospho-L-lactate guanylyltransferase